MGMWHAYADLAEISTGADRQSPEQPTLGELHPKFLDVRRTVARSGDAIAREEAILDAAGRLRGPVQCGSISLQDAIDDLDIGRANSLLTSAIEAEIGHRLRGEIDGWRKAAVHDRASGLP